MSNILATSLEAAQATVLTGALQRVSDLNAALTTDYLARFNSWANNVKAGIIANTDPPQPPKAFTIGYINDPTTGPGTLSPYGDLVVTWAYAAVGTEPVCAMPTIPGIAVHPTGTMLIGTQNVAAPQWFNAQVGDKTPIGTVAPGMSQDGIFGLFQKVGSPAGSGYFLKIG